MPDQGEELLRESILSLLDTMQRMKPYPSRVVGCFDRGRTKISTARVCDGFQPFETAVMHPDYNEGKFIIVESYPDEAKAEQGHYRWVQTMTHEPLPESLSDCVNCPQSQLSVRAGSVLKYDRQR